jgi:hypothetical protein
MRDRIASGVWDMMVIFRSWVAGADAPTKTGSRLGVALVALRLRLYKIPSPLDGIRLTHV